MKKKPAKDSLTLPSKTATNEINGRTGGPRLLKEINSRAVFRLLRENTPCSRADLVRMTGLTAPTVSGAVEHLMKLDLVESLGYGASSGGRRPDLLRFNSTYGYVAGVDLGGTNLRIALADLEGNILGKWSSPTHNSRTPERVIEKMRNGLAELLQRTGVPPSKLLAVAAGAPGITDVEAGIVISAPHLQGWKDIPLRVMIESALGIPAVIENDVNLAAIGESWIGAARAVRDFVFLGLGTGIGAGIVINGQLFHGSDWAAGEVGYMHVPGTPDISFVLDKPGSLESVIGGRSIERRWKKMWKEADRSDQNAPQSLSVTEIFEYARTGDLLARTVLDQTARILAHAILNISLIVNCSLFVLGGGVGMSVPLYDATRRILERNELVRPQLTLSVLGSDAQLMGAVRIALDRAEMNIGVSI